MTLLLKTMERKQGNLLNMAQEGQFDVIVHGANCFNTMASGIAGQISRIFPEAVAADNVTRSGDRNKLGTFTMAQISTENGSPLTIVNAYTQYTFSRGEDVFEYEAFSKFLQSFASLLELCYNGQPIRVGFPYIGCGLAGGDQSRIVSMLENFSNICTMFAIVILVEYKSQ